ncbi:Protein BYPASS-related [Melia azedarach]|uniref:Protein BYPASS-related n=1 Tax=Melia azedarach TaxID=155640 RepID=A0ACC1XUH3_MELAZ|nr:Protein BYPASS-related [Melia azedarach]
MKSSSILRSLSLRIPPMRLSGSSRAAVVPLPIRTSFDQQLTAELDALQASAASYEHITWLLNALKASSSAQEITLHSLQKLVFQDLDTKAIDRYLDFNIRMLDSCNELTEKMEMIQNYVDSLRVVAHLVEGNAEPHPTTLARVGDVLDSCQEMEKRINEMGKCGSASSGLRKIFSQKHYSNHHHTSQTEASGSRLGEILNGSMAITSTVCAILGNALSFKSKRGLPIPQQQVQSVSSWSCSLQQLQKQVKDQKKSGSAITVMELPQIAMVARSLKDQIKPRKQNELRLFDMEELKSSCGKVEEGIKALEERVKALYKSLISVRMALLGILSNI